MLGVTESDKHSSLITVVKVLYYRAQLSLFVLVSSEKEKTFSLTDLKYSLCQQTKINAVKNSWSLRCKTFYTCNFCFTVIITML